MLKDIEEFLRLREERVKLGRRTVVVRELEVAKDLGVEPGSEDTVYALTVRCVFDEDGKPVFEMADVPKLKAFSKRKFMVLYEAVQRVNGLDLEAEVKNSEAAPG